MGHANMHLFHLIERFKAIQMALIQVQGEKSSFILVTVLCNQTKYKRVRETEAISPCQVLIPLMSESMCLLVWVWELFISLAPRWQIIWKSGLMSSMRINVEGGISQLFSPESWGWKGVIYFHVWNPWVCYLRSCFFSLVPGVVMTVMWVR